MQGSDSTPWWLGIAIAIAALLLMPRPAAARTPLTGLGLGLPALSAPRWQTEAPALPPPPVKLPEATPPSPPEPAPEANPAPATSPGYELVGEHAAPPATEPEPTPPAEVLGPKLRLPWDPGTLAVQLLMEGGASLASTLFGLGAAMILGSGGWDTLAYIILGSAIAGLVLHPLAAYLGGKWMRGQGSVLGTILGFVLGIGGAILVSGLGSALGEPATTLFALLATAIFYAGPIVGYHLSARRVARPENMASRARNAEARERLLALQAARPAPDKAHAPRTFPLLALRY